MEEARLDEFRSIRVFPSLLGVHGGHMSTATEVLLEDRKIRAERERQLQARQRRKEQANKKALEAFRPTKEITCLSDLREQIKRRKSSKGRLTQTRMSKARTAEYTSLERAPFRPCNPSEAKANIASPRGHFAKNPFDEREHRPDGAGARTWHRRQWKPASGRAGPAVADTYLNSSDAESLAQERARLDKMRKKMEQEFKDRLRVRLASARSKQVMQFFARVDARITAKEHKHRALLRRLA